MKLEDVKGDDALGAREYRGKIFRILKSTNFFYIEEYKKPTILFWMKPSWRRYNDDLYSDFSSEDDAVSYYKYMVDIDLLDKEKAEIVVPLTADEKVVKDIIE